MRRLFAYAVFFLSTMSAAQSADDIEAIMKLFGENDPENLDSYEVERLSDMLERPLKINVSTSSVMTSCGLFSRYQVASLMDYRVRHGDVLSFSELAALDGFGRDFVDRIAPFISLYSNHLPGVGADTSAAAISDLAVRTGIKEAGQGCQWNAAVKYRVETGERLSASVSLSRSVSAYGLRPDAWSGSVEWDFLQYPVKILFGDFNARFGQGLALWNGMTMSGLSSSSSFIRASPGISRSWSFTGSASFTGMASEMNIGNICTSVMLALPGIKNISSTPEVVTLLPAINLVWNRSRGQFGLTHYAELSGLSTAEETRIPDMKTSADMSFCIDGVDFGSEVSFDWVSRAVAALCAVRLAAGENLRLASILRFYPSSYSAEKSGAVRSGTKCSNEFGATFAGYFSAGEWVKINGAEGFGSSVRRHSGSFSLDGAYYPIPKKGAEVSAQIKALVSWEAMLTDSFRLKVRLAERLRTWGRHFRTDARIDVSWLLPSWEMTARFNALQCDGIGLLSYIEGGYRNGPVAFYLRMGIYKIDDWDDRIYVYERDAPGSFNVPAFHGAGCWVSAMMSWRFARWGRVYLRASKKPGKAELKVQGVFSF